MVIGIFGTMLGCIITIVSAVAAVSSAALACGIWKTAKKAMMFQGLVDVQKDYRSSEMLHAVKTLWDFYRQEGKANFVEKYEERRKQDDERITKIRETERLKAEQCTLHYLRRVVSHFYQHLGALYKNGVLPKSIVYDSWSEQDLKIIPEILVPIENKLRQVLSGTGPLGTDHPLLVLYEDSRKK
jgi:hypothetical protein